MFIQKGRIVGLLGLVIPCVRFDVSTNRLLFHPDKSGENENITIKLNTTVEFLYKIE